MPGTVFTVHFDNTGHPVFDDETVEALVGQRPWVAFGPDWEGPGEKATVLSAMSAGGRVHLNLALSRTADVSVFHDRNGAVTATIRVDVAEKDAITPGEAGYLPSVALRGIMPVDPADDHSSPSWDLLRGEGQYAEPIG